MKRFAAVLSPLLVCLLCDEADSHGGVPGVPGRDYPVLATVPPTLFSCRGQVEGGYYADPQTDCQAFHVCVDQGKGRLDKVSFLCPNGTLFQQEYFTCDWWFNVDCTTARSLWSINRHIAAQRLTSPYQPSSL